MGSLNFEKAKNRVAIRNVLAYCDSAKRMSRSNSKNLHIDKQKTMLNYDMEYLSYEESYKKFTDRLDYLDSTTNTNKRKNRLEACFFEISSISYDKDTSDKFFADVYKYFKDMYGKDNIINGFVHYDEVHDYMKQDGDEVVTVTSLPHMHFLVIPEIDGKLNGRQFTSRKNMYAWHRAVDKIAREKYNTLFLTGNKEKPDWSVEKLKAESLRLECDVLREEISKLKAELKALQDEYVSVYNQKKKNE